MKRDKNTRRIKGKYTLRKGQKGEFVHGSPSPSWFGAKLWRGAGASGIAAAARPPPPCHAHTSPTPPPKKITITATIFGLNF